ncbi:MAG: hypothetical protein H0T57_17530 [Rubrobacter sp.]|nr:hypothetical protein [Rubrobacter sp.]MDQ3638014.1 hypothetical protein [Actinomycetota bacterium]
MNNAPRTASSWWYDLQQSLGGSFTARARGLLSTKFDLLNPEVKEFGQLRLRGPSVAEFESGDHAATLTRTEGSYRMVAEGDEVLTAAPKERSIDELEISCGDRTYEARVSFFRNLAVASYQRGGGRAVHVSGGLVGRSYGVLFAPDDGCALPAAVFLLWHVAANRRRAYRMGSPMGGGVM